MTTPGRATTAYVSMYALDNVQQVRSYRAQKTKYRCIWNGALDEGVTVSSVTWYVDAPWVLRISDAEISDDGRETLVMVESNLDGYCNMKCEVTLSTGEVRNQLFRTWVRPQPWSFGAGNNAAGPYSVSTSTVGFIAMEDDSGDAPYVELEDA